MFYAREEELKRLNDAYIAGGFSCVVIYGRRRVGKTTLIKEFIKEKPAVYFAAREASSSLNLKAFGRDILSALGKNPDENFFRDWSQAFDFIGDVARARRIILVVDEYPRLAENNEEVLAAVRARIETGFGNGRLFLILCGSKLSFMEKQTLDSKNQIFGARFFRLNVKPFSYFDSRPFLTGYTKTEQGIFYGFTGGAPGYLNKIDKEKTVRENIVDLFLTEDGYFFDEPSNQINRELREPSTYNEITAAISGGASRLNEIAEKCEIESNKCAKYINSLMALGIVKKENPVTETGGKKSIYLLDDQMFRFWYRFVFPNLSAIAAGRGEEVFDRDVAPNIDEFMRLPFGEICKQYLMSLSEKDALPLQVKKFGRWWGSNLPKKRYEEIDVMALRGNAAIYCECVWADEPMGVDALISLKERSELFSFNGAWFFLFAKNGFTEELVNEAGKDDKIRLIRFEDK
jgi:AAA+ ATPase superfamily predicted ATPase